MEKCYSVTIQQTLKRTLTLPIPKSGLTQKEIEEVLSKMNFGNYFDPDSGILNLRNTKLRSKKMKMRLIKLKMAMKMIKM